MSYSIDLRERIIKFVEEGHSKTEAAKVFGISRFTILNWLGKKRKSLSQKRSFPMLSCTLKQL
jgi:transposase